MLRVSPTVIKSNEYKTFGNMFTETKMTPEHRETVEKLLDSAFDQITEGIAKNRNMKKVFAQMQCWRP